MRNEELAQLQALGAGRDEDINWQNWQEEEPGCWVINFPILGIEMVHITLSDAPQEYAGYVKRNGPEIWCASDNDPYRVLRWLAENALGLIHSPEDQLVKSNACVYCGKTVEPGDKKNGIYRSSGGRAHLDCYLKTERRVVTKVPKPRSLALLH